MAKIGRLMRTTGFLMHTAMVAALALALPTVPVMGQDCRTITYATNSHYPPFGWEDRHGAYAGAAIALLKMTVPEKIALQPIMVPWKRAQAMAALGTIDLLLAIRETPQRKEDLVFTEHRAFPNPIAVFTRSDSDLQYRDWNDLKGRVGGISAGDSFGSGFDEFLKKELTIETAPTVENNFGKLEKKRIDYFISSRYFGRAFLTNNAKETRIKVHQVPVTDGNIAFAFSKKSPCAPLVAAFSHRFEVLDERGILTSLIEDALVEFSIDRDTLYKDQ